MGQGGMCTCTPPPACPYGSHGLCTELAGWPPCCDLPDVVAEVVLRAAEQNQEGGGVADVHQERHTSGFSPLRGFISRIQEPLGLGII